MGEVLIVLFMTRDSVIDRRAFLVLLGLGSLAAPRAVRAQQAGKVPVVGVLNTGMGPR